MKTFIKLISLLLIISMLRFPAMAEDTTAADLTPESIPAKLKDNSASTYSTLSEIKLSAQENIKSIYIIFRSKSIGFSVDNGSETAHFDGGYLQYFADISDKFTGETKELTITLGESISVCDIFAFGEGELPDFVHNWEAPYEKADLLLFTSHADDEQLFFAGILPYYAGELGLRVQVAYFTDHINEPGRRHELLNGLWTVGIRNYPEISEFPDEYSETYDGALSNLKRHGFTEDDVIAYQTMLLRRFKPLVAVGHDLEGEYGHGQHKLNSGTLTKAVELAVNAEYYPDSAEEYGVWDTPKLYLHLYGENTIVMNWDVPLETFGGKTAFQVTQDGFQCHKSQHYTWFNTWLNGSGNITKASQITQHSPQKYGLYRTTVGADVEKNDFFENVTTYAEQERIAAEEEAKRQEEESRKAEEESKRTENEISETTAASDNQSSKPAIGKELTFALIIIAVVIVAMIITVKVMNSNNKKKKRIKR